MIRDGNGRMAPADGLLDHFLRICQSIHIAHFGMEMELHTLDRSGILALSMLSDIDMEGVELHILTIPGQLHLALDQQPHTGLDGTLELLGLLSIEKLHHGDGVGIIRHIKGQPPGTGPPGLLTLVEKDLAADRGSSHLQIQFTDGNRLSLDGISHENFGGGRLVPSLFLNRSSLRDRTLLHFRSKRGHEDLHLPEGINLADHLLKRCNIFLSQRRLRHQIQHDTHAPLVNGCARQFRASELEPQLRRELQLREHIKKRNIFRHDSRPVKVSRSLPSKHPQVSPAAPCKGVLLFGKAVLPRYRRQCRYRRQRPRRDR